MLLYLITLLDKPEVCKSIKHKCLKNGNRVINQKKIDNQNYIINLKISLKSNRFQLLTCTKSLRKKEEFRKRNRRKKIRYSVNNNKKKSYDNGKITTRISSVGNMLR